MKKALLIIGGLAVVGGIYYFGFHLPKKNRIASDFKPRDPFDEKQWDEITWLKVMPPSAPIPLAVRKGNQYWSVNIGGTGVRMATTYVPLTKGRFNEIKKDGKL